MDIQRVSLPEQHYLYVDREASITGADIAEAMGSGFGELFGFNAQHGIKPLSMPSTIYIAMPSGPKMAFRAAVFVSPADAATAAGDIKSATIPAGDAFKATYVGPYSHLNEGHNAIWGEMDKQGATKSMPVWEVYIDDPHEVPEAKLRTELYRAVG